MAKILLVDDEVSILNMMKLSLEADGYKVVTATNGRQAIEAYKNELPDLVLLDVRLPEMDGLTILGLIKEINKDAEVIIISGHGDMDVAVECMRKEASNFLSKPISDELLSISIQRSLEKVNLKRKLKQYTRNLETLVREANIELERTYQFRENIIANSPDAIVCIRKGGEIMIFNSAAERLTGYSKEDVIGKMNIVNLYPPGVARKIMADLKSSDFGGRDILQKRQVNILDKQGNEIPVYISAAVLYENGREAGSMGVFTDLREKRLLEKQLLRSEKLSLLGKLSTSIAHEINQPLTRILTSAHLLLNKFRDDQATCTDLETIASETTRIRGIVQGILDFAREMPMQKKPWIIHEILDKIVEILFHEQKFFGVTLEKEYDSSIQPVVVDSNLMEQVFMNIILNALDAMKGSGTLTIKTRDLEDAVEIDLQDTGPGIPEDIMDKIFDPFFTTKESTGGAGMGLGLAVSYGIVRNHNGEITVISKEGLGSTFTIRLPRGLDV